MLWTETGPKSIFKIEKEHGSFLLEGNDEPRTMGIPLIPLTFFPIGRLS